LESAAFSNGYAASLLNVCDANNKKGTWIKGEPFPEIGEPGGDKTAPVITGLTAARTSASKATVTFGSDEAGVYWHAFTSIDKIGKMPLPLTKGDNELKVNMAASAGAALYIVVSDTSGNESELITTTIPAHTSGGNNGGGNNGSGTVTPPASPGDEAGDSVGGTPTESHPVFVQTEDVTHTFDSSKGIDTIAIKPGSITDTIKKAIDMPERNTEPTIIVIKVEAAAEAAKDDIVIKAVNVEIHIDDMKAIAESDVKVKIESAVGEVTLNKAAAEDIIAEAGDTESVTVIIERKNAADDELTEGQKADLMSDEKIRDAYDISLSAGGKKLEDFTTTGTLTISLPYELKPGEVPAGVGVVYIGIDGEVDMRAKYARDMATFDTDHLSLYAVTYKTVNYESENGGASSGGGCSSGAASALAILAALTVLCRPKRGTD
jgi:hypothetical protein